MLGDRGLIKMKRRDYFLGSSVHQVPHDFLHPWLSANIWFRISGLEYKAITLAHTQTPGRIQEVEPSHYVPSITPHFYTLYFKGTSRNPLGGVYFLDPSRGLGSNPKPQTLSTPCPSSSFTVLSPRRAVHLLLWLKQGCPGGKG